MANDELYDALIAAGIPEEKARAISDSLGRAMKQNHRRERSVPEELVPAIQSKEDLRIIVLDATTCFIAGHKTVSLEVALEIMRTLGKAEEGET